MFADFDAICPINLSRYVGAIHSEITHGFAEAFLDLRFGFTGAHFHKNWGDDNFRKVALNAVLWIAKAQVPPNGVESTVTPKQITQNLDPKPQPANAPNLTGKWNVQVETQNGTGTPTFTFVHAGQNLLGAYKGLLGEADVFGSVTKDQDVKFSLKGKLQEQE